MPEKDQYWRLLTTYYLLLTTYLAMPEKEQYWILVELLVDLLQKRSLITGEMIKKLEVDCATYYLLLTA